MGNLVLWELGKKQNYIFKSNKLKDSIGASLIIKDFSEDFFQEKLNENNFIMRGGGKTLYYFDEDDKCEKFIRDISFKVLKDFPGLELLITKVNFNPKENVLKDKISEIYRKLDKKKNEGKHLCSEVGFGIEKKCNQTGMPASYKDEDEFISEEVYTKRQYVEKHQQTNFNDLIPEKYELETSLDSLVNKTGKQYIGVIHIDGNGMGKKVKSLQDNIKKTDNESLQEFNERYKNYLIKFSKEINKIYKNAFKEMCRIVEKNKDKIKDQTLIDKNIFPIRPVILAGDDITYICNGSIAIETARIMLEILEKKTLTVNDIKFGNLSACAGISIIKKGYPFKKGYELAEELCSSSKKFLLENNLEGNSAMDFHISQGDLTTLKSIRKCYIGNNGEILTMKPLLIDKNEFRSYGAFLKSIEYINKFSKEEKIGRNKIKLMREAIFKGKKATENFFKFYKINDYLGTLTGIDDEYGFSKDGTCLLLDGIEVMDFFKRLD